MKIPSSLIYFSSLTALLFTSANAARIIVDFEVGNTFSKSIEDTDATDGITINTTAANINNWTVSGGSIGAGNIRSDNHTNPTSGNFVARFEGGNRIYSIVLDVAAGESYNFDRISFDARGATGGSAGGSGRAASFAITTSSGTTQLWNNPNLPGRSFGWDSQDIDLTALPNAADYANLEDEQITFTWTMGGASDLDSIAIFATIPEPSTSTFIALGAFLSLVRRKR